MRQCIFGLASGYEDLNDHETLQKDLVKAFFDVDSEGFPAV